MATTGLCPTCIHSVWCPTWAEWKCTVKSKRIPVLSRVKVCSDFKKRDKDFEEPKCQCKNCLENDILWNEENEENA